MQRTKEGETENRRGWRALAVRERNEERLWALRPAVKQDGGQQGTLCQTTEGAEQQRGNRMRLRAVLPAEQRESGRRGNGRGRGQLREEKSAGLSEWSRIGPWRRQHPGEKTVLSQSAGVKA